MARPLMRVGRFLQDEKGAALPEYALLLALVATVTLAAISSLSNGVTAVFQRMTILLGGN